MKRKLIAQGVGGVTVHLPISWVRKRKLRAGDEIDIDEKSGTLVIAGSGKGFRVKELRVTEAHRSLLRSIIAGHYRLGYYELRLHFEGGAPVKEISDVLQTLIGYELVDRTKTSCTIRDIMGVTEESLDSTLNKLFQNVDLLFEMVADKASREELDAQRASILKFRDYCERRIALSGDEDSHELYALAIFIEKIAGECYYYAKNGHAPANLQRTHALFKEAHKCFLKKEFIGSNRLYLSVRRQAQEQNEDVRGVVDGYVSRILEYLLGMASRLQAISK